MTTEIVPMIADKREIAGIICTYGGSNWAGGDITRIEIYQENGPMAPINYAALYKEDFLFARVDLTGWTVIYKEPN